MLKKLILVSFVAALFSPAFASDFEAACIIGSPDGVSEAESQGYCSCLAAATSGDDEIQSEFLASWPVDDLDAWLAGLSADAAEAAGSCAP